MTTVANHLTQKPQPLRQRAPEAKISAELDTLVLQMLEKNPAGRPQNMAVVEAMLCDAQIAAHVQTEWDDLNCPRWTKPGGRTGRPYAVSALPPLAPSGLGSCRGGHPGIGRSAVLWSAAAQGDRRVHAGVCRDHQDRRG